LEKEDVDRRKAEKEQGIAQNPVSQAPEAAPRAIFPHGQRWNIARSPAVEIARCRVMRGMVLPPDVVRGQRQDTKHTPDPVARLPVLQERAMPAILLDHEEAQQEEGIDQGKAEGQRGTDGECRPRQGPKAYEWHKGDGEFEDCAGEDWSAIRGKDPRPVMRLQ
jgi:hypothetical protein